MHNKVVHMPYGDGTGPWWRGYGCRRPMARRQMTRDEEIRMLEQEKETIDREIKQLKGEQP